MMKLTGAVVLGVVSLTLAAACGDGSGAGSTILSTQAAGTSTAAEVPPLAERAQLFTYDNSTAPQITVKKKQKRGGSEVDDVAFGSGGRTVSAFLVHPKGKPRAAVLWAHWYASEPNSNRTEFLADARALAKDGVMSLLPQGLFPWKEQVTGDPDTDRGLAVEQVIQLRRGLDVLQAEAGDVPLGFVGHDYGAMFGSLLVADERPKTYVLMAPDASFANWFIKYFARSASLPAYEKAFVGLDPLDNVGDAAPASVFFQFAKSDHYVPNYIADKLFGAASDPKREKTYDGGHELDSVARADRLAWLREQLGV